MRCAKTKWTERTPCHGVSEGAGTAAEEPRKGLAEELGSILREENGSQEGKPWQPAAEGLLDETQAADGS